MFVSAGLNFKMAVMITKASLDGLIALALALALALDLADQ
jgi:uncharacterized membrane protein YqgA involved in biofilm formation